MGLFDFFKSSDTENINGVEFPKFNGKASWKDGRNKPNYKRKNFYYNVEESVKLPEYISKVNSYGFMKKTEVRYENSKGDYIIIDPNYKYGRNTSKLHIGFHAKK